METSNPRFERKQRNNDKNSEIAILKLRFCYLRIEMKMIRAGGVFNFREMIAHVNSNKELQDFYNSFSHPTLNTWFYALSLFC